MSRRRDMEPQAVSQPFSLSAEHAIIGAILHDPRDVLIEVESKIKEEYFYDPFCRAAYRKAQAIAASKAVVDIVLLAARMEGVSDLTEQEAKEALQGIYLRNPNRINLDGWCSMLHERWMERQLTAVGARLYEMAHVQEMSVADKVAETHRLLAEVGNVMSDEAMVTTEHMVAQTLHQVEENATKGGGITGVATGWDELDQMTTGFQPGDLIVLAARPSMGKTSLALAIAKHISAEVPIGERLHVAFFSMEMGVTQIGMRWLSVLNDIPLQHLRTGSLDATEYARLGTAMEDSVDQTFHLEDESTLTIEQIAGRARRMKRERSLGLIVVDYLQLIQESAASKNDNKAERVAQISRGLKKLAGELKVPIIALSQLSRTLESRQDKRPIMSDLRESGAIEQDADIIMFLYRDYVYNKNTPLPNEAEVIIAKHRNGETGTVKLQFHPSTTGFHDGKTRPRSFATV